MSSPTKRSLDVLEELGYTAEVVERWNSFGKVRQDLFGVIDIVACHGHYGILGIQATTTQHISDRIKKAQAEPRLAVWLDAGGLFEVWGWARRGPEKRWTLRRDRL